MTRILVPAWVTRVLCGNAVPSHAAALDGLCEAIAADPRAVAHFEPTFVPLVGSGTRMAPVQSGCRQVPAWRAE